MNIKITDTVSISIHKDGLTTVAFISSLFIISLLLSGMHTVTLLLLIFTFISTWFFRNPNRVIPNEKNIVISPADGKITKIEHEVTLPEELGTENHTDKYTRISIFLNIDNVHVQRVPVSSIVKRINYVKGAFISATLDKSSKDNERNIVLFETKDTKKFVACVQIAGFVARRILCDLKIEDEVNIGDIYGIIKFGSRVDVYIPSDFKIIVLNGQTMIGGETILARY
jgi:phosphatidylserine decarboxylase